MTLPAGHAPFLISKKFIEESKYQGVIGVHCLPYASLLSVAPNAFCFNACFITSTSGITAIKDRAVA